MGSVKNDIPGISLSKKKVCFLCFRKTDYLRDHVYILTNAPRYTDDFFP